MEKYKKIKEIGRGSFAVIWLAEDEKGQRLVLKHYASQNLSEARREYLYLVAAAGVNVPVARSFYTDMEGVWLAMEYIEGESLTAGAFSSEQELNKWFYRLVRQVLHLQGLGICLNDLKPDNILIRSDEPYLLDFGLATPNHYNDGIFRGNIAYASPEKLLFKSCHFASDIFALGLLYYFLIKGEHPSEKRGDDFWQEILRTRERWEAWLESASLPDFLKSMLNWSVSERMSAVSVLHWFATLAGEEIESGLELAQSYHFQIQDELAEQLLRQGRLRCHPDDEPERIAEQAMLRSEAAGKAVVIIREEELLEERELILERLRRILGVKLENINDLWKNDWEGTQLLVIFPRQAGGSPFFDRLSSRPGILFLEISQESQAHFVKPAEYEEYFQLLGQKPSTGVKEPLSIAAVRLLARADKPTAPEQASAPLLQMAAWLGYWLPVQLAAIWEKNWADNLAAGLHSGMIILSGSAFKAVESFYQAEEPAAAEQYLALALEQEYYLTASLIYLRQGNKAAGIEFMEKHYRFLVQQGFLVSAWQALSILDTFLDWEGHGYSLQKAKAYLARQLGDATLSLELYGKIGTAAGSEEEAVIKVDMAIAQQELGNFAAAVKANQEALVYFRQSGKEKAEMRCLNNLAAVYYEQRDFNRCSAIYQEIIGLTETKAKQAFARNYNVVAQINLADVFLHKAQWKRAHIYARNAVQAARKMQVPAYRLQAELIAVFALFAQKETADLDRIITELQQDEALVENPALAKELLTYILPLWQGIAVNKALEELEPNLKIAETLSENVLLALFFTAWQNRDGKALQTLYPLLKEPLLHKLAEGLFLADRKLVIRNLGELSRLDDCWLYINYGYQLALAGWQQDAEVHKELEKILELYSFYPLEQILKAQKQETPEHLSLLWDIVSMIHNKVEFESIIAEVLRGIIKIAGLDRALFYELQEGKLKAVQGINSELQAIDLESVRVSETILLATLEENEIRFLTDLQEATNFDIHSSIFGLGLRTAVCYPLRFESAIQGVIYSDARAERVFSSEEKKLIESIMVQGRSAYEKVLHWQKLQEQQVAQLVMLDPATGGELVGNSPQMQKIYQMIGTVARHNVNILITGETGTGKELIARAIHRIYAPEKPFIPVNCAAIPETLLESELFGYVKGAFTGADQNKQGLISAARGGTLFLDEIGDMPVALQAKLLRMIQERQVTPLGSYQPEKVDVRIVAATNQELENAIEQGTFRQDLYYRLKVIKINIPPLRERSDDIPHLIQHFISKFNERFHKNVQGITLQAMAFLQNRQFPGNVRELENEIERAMVLCPGQELTLELFEKGTARSEFSLDENMPFLWDEYKEYRKRITGDIDLVYARRLMKSARGNASKAAELGRLSRTQLYRLLGRD
ncbi:MAG: sigma 54-interacting transcriptional regulator [Candidatus Cloacimonetes bacterium]|nr:sigma 54-interacting transcriptional regulator [Candidatus Cloacimonadota bacterium]